MYTFMHILLTCVAGTCFLTSAVSTFSETYLELYSHKVISSEHGGLGNKDSNDILIINRQIYQQNQVGKEFSPS